MTPACHSGGRGRYRFQDSQEDIGNPVLGKQNDNHKRMLIKEGNCSKKSLKFGRLTILIEVFNQDISIAYPLCCLKPFSAQVMNTMYHITIIGPL